jgi:hypothetical protein
MHLQIARFKLHAAKHVAVIRAYVWVLLVLASVMVRDVSDLHSLWLCCTCQHFLSFFG